MADFVKFVPLGGLGRMGCNCAIYETEQDMIIVDCGAALPYVEEPGVEYVLPDMAYVYERQAKLRAIFITHAHEDHLGALTHILKKLDVPVYATRFALEVLKQRLKEGPVYTPDLRTIVEREVIVAGVFRVEALAVTHSIPEAVAFVIHSPEGILIHTGDFKIDDNPIDGRLTDSAGFKALGEKGVLGLLSDSTNAGESGHSRSEHVVLQTLHSVISKLKTRILFTTFSSNIHRLQAVIDASVANARFIVPVGRSMKQYLEMALEQGYLTAPPDVLLDVSQFESLPRDRVTVVASGTQGEMFSTVSRIARDEFADVHLERGDTIIWSARKIPGNERAIGFMMNALWERGIDVIDERIEPVHASGHAYQEEHRMMLDWCKPKYFIPLHGERRMLEQHAKLVRAAGYADENIFVVENGEPIMWQNGQGFRGEAFEYKPTYVDGNQIGDVTKPVINERLNLARRGLVVCWAILQAGSVDQIVIRTQGITSKNADTWQPQAEEAAKRALESALQSGDDLQEALRLAIRRYFRLQWERHPVIAAHVIKV
jgi:ribonuclease J